MPGMIGMVDAGLAGLRDDTEVVVRVEEHLRDREVGAGLLLGQQRGDVLRAGAAGGVVAARERRDRDRQRTDARAHRLRRAVRAPLRLDLAAAARPARPRSAGRRGAPPSPLWSDGRVAAQREERAHALVEELLDDRRDLLARRADAGQVRDRVERRLAQQPADQRARGDPRLARGAVGDRDEVRVDRLERLDGGPQARRGVRVARREELEGDGRPVVGRLRARRRARRAGRACGVPRAAALTARPAGSSAPVRCGDTWSAGTSGSLHRPWRKHPHPRRGGGLLRRRRARSLGRSGW